MLAEVNIDGLQKEDYLLGVRYWAQHFSFRPREVYIYIGKHKTQPLAYFKSRETNAVIWRKISDLGQYGFKPFLLDFKKINEATDNAYL